MRAAHGLRRRKAERLRPLRLPRRREGIGGRLVIDAPRLRKIVHRLRVMLVERVEHRLELDADAACQQEIDHAADAREHALLAAERLRQAERALHVIRAPGMLDDLGKQLRKPPPVQADKLVPRPLAQQHEAVPPQQRPLEHQQIRDDIGMQLHLKAVLRQRDAIFPRAAFLRHRIGHSLREEHEQIPLLKPEDCHLSCGIDQLRLRRQGERLTVCEAICGLRRAVRREKGNQPPRRLVPCEMLHVKGKSGDAIHACLHPIQEKNAFPK